MMRSRLRSLLLRILGEVWVLRTAGVFFLALAVWFFSLASAWRLRGAGVAPVRGGTYLSLPR
jgi:hypothetical protein